MKRPVQCVSCFFRSIFKKSNYITNSRRCGANPPTSVQDLLLTSFVFSSDLPTLPSIVWCLNGHIIWNCFLFISWSISNFTWNLQATLCSQLGRTSQATPHLGSRFKILNSDRFFCYKCFFLKYSRALKVILSIFISDPPSPAVHVLPSLLPKDSAALAT